MGDKSDGSILELRNVISLRYSFYCGWRNVKILSAARYATAVSAVSTTSTYFYSRLIAKVSQIMLNFALILNAKYIPFLL